MSLLHALLHLNMLDVTSLNCNRLCKNGKQINLGFLEGKLMRFWLRLRN
nr:hypothetical protein Iba_chr01aCG21130 [Ipomoea batatas]